MSTTLLYAAGASAGRIKKTDEMRALLIDRLANDVYALIPMTQRRRMQQIVEDAVCAAVPQGVPMEIGADLVARLERKLRKEAEALAAAPETPPRHAGSSSSSSSSSNLFGGQRRTRA